MEPMALIGFLGIVVVGLGLFLKLLLRLRNGTTFEIPLDEGELLALQEEGRVGTILAE